MQEFNPSDYRIDEAAVAEESAEAQWAHKATAKVSIEQCSVIVSEEASKAHYNALILKGRLGILSPRDGVSRINGGPYTGLWVCLPIQNANVPGHKPPEWASGMFSTFCEGFLGEHYPKGPYQDKTSKRWKYTGKITAPDANGVEVLVKEFTGDCEPGDIAMIKSWRARRRLALAQWIKATNGEALVRKCFSYAQSKIKEGRQGWEFLPEAPKGGLSAEEDLLVKMKLDGGSAASANTSAEGEAEVSTSRRRVIAPE